MHNTLQFLSVICAPCKINCPVLERKWSRGSYQPVNQEEVKSALKATVNSRPNMTQLRWPCKVVLSLSSGLASRWLWGVINRSYVHKRAYAVVQKAGMGETTFLFDLRPNVVSDTNTNTIWFFFISTSKPTFYLKEFALVSNKASHNRLEWNYL